MKKIVWMFASFAFLGLGATAQNAIPAAAKADFAKRFPNAAQVRWERDGKNFEGEFRENGTEISGVYDGTGQWLMTERSMAVSELPAPAKQGAMKHAPGAEIKEVEQMQLANGSTQYEVKVLDHGKWKELLIDSNGKVLHAQAEGGKGSNASASDKGDDGRGSGSGSGSGSEGKSKKN